MAIIFCGTATADMVFDVAGATEPVVDGDRMVWTQKDSTGHTAVYVKNLKTGHKGKVKTSTEDQYSPDISGTRVVWVQKDSKRKQTVYIKNIATGSYGKVLSTKYNQDKPAISGNRIVWEEFIGDEGMGLNVVYLKNLATGKSGKVKTQSYHQYNPDISGTRIIWHQDKYPNNYDDSLYSGNFALYLMNLETGTWGKVKTSTENQYQSAISGKRIVWTQTDSDKSTVYLKNLATGLSGKVHKFTTEDQWCPGISGTRVVWVQEESGKCVVYVKNMATGYGGKVQKATEEQYDPVISGTRIVWDQWYDRKITGDWPDPTTISTDYYAVYLKNLATGKIEKVAS